MASTPSREMTNELRASFEALIAAVRETTPSGARPVPDLPSNFNMLARPHHNTCQVCGLTGHTATNIHTDNAMCRAGILSTIGFWEELWEHLYVCFHNSDRFQDAINKLIPRYEMRPESSFPPVPGGLEVVLADHLAKQWIHFLEYRSRMRPKLVVLLNNQEMDQFEEVVRNLNWLFLGGVTFSTLFEQSDIARQ